MVNAYFNTREYENKVSNLNTLILIVRNFIVRNKFQPKIFVGKGLTKQFFRKMKFVEGWGAAYI